MIVRRVALCAALSLTSASALADLGPPPSCPSGTHSAYLFGRRCVKDGYHPEAAPAGGVVEVKDGATSPAPPAPPDPAFATPPPKPIAAPEEPPPVAPPPSKPELPSPVPIAPKSNGCAVAPIAAGPWSAGPIAWAAFGVAVAVARARRRTR